MKLNWIVGSLSVMALSGALATSALAQGPGAPGHKMERARKFVRALDLSRAQQEQALSVARAAQPIMKDLRQRIATERNQGRAHVKELVRNAFAELGPQVRGLMATLTPDQRARLAALAARHGRTLDDARLERRLAYLLSRPGAAARLQARLER